MICTILGTKIPMYLALTVNVDEAIEDSVKDAQGFLCQHHCGVILCALVLIRNLFPVDEVWNIVAPYVTLQCKFA